jgi:hypothetical protein
LEGFVKKITFFLISLVVLGLVSIACEVFTPNDTSLKQTEVALSVQQTSLAMQQGGEIQQPPPDNAPPPNVQPQATYTPYPTFTQPAPEQPAQEDPPTEAPPTSTVTITIQPTDDVLFQSVTTDRTVFHCVPGDGPTTLTITVEMSDINRGATLFWRLEEKANNNTTDWEVVDMQRAGGNTRSYTFDADSWTGTNNFFYPPLMGESWFEYQIVSNDGLVRTDVFTDVSFFPCAQ